jgi:hypothetical protein
MTDTSNATSDTTSDTRTIRFPLDGPINLHARVAHGSLTVRAAESITEAEVVLAPRAKGSDIAERTTVEMHGPTLTVTTPRRGGVFDLGLFGGGPFMSRDQIDVTITVPAGTALRLATYTAPVEVSGRSGSADVATGAADITLEHVDGDLRLRFGSGSARAERVAGTAQVRSGSGNASFGDVGGSLICGCGSGDLDVDSVRGAVRSRTGSGSARLGVVYSDVDLSSGSGGVEIGLPRGHAAQLNVVTGSGKVRSDLPVDERPRAGSPKIAIRARTGSGDVRLYRAPAASDESVPTDAA